nr:reverse transcriptase domain-containing protein [Tanacetum cinerariifolium]
MSAVANTTSLVTTVTKPATNPRDADATPKVNIQEFCEEYYEDILPIIMDKPATNPRDADATPKVNIQEFCEEYYEDILPIIMDKVRRNRRKDVHTRLDFGEGPRERTREDSHHSSARARTTKPERLKVQDRLRYGDRHALDRLDHRRQSAFDRLSETYSPSTTKSRPRGTDSRDHPRGRSRPHRLNTSKEDRPKDRERFRSVGESYDDSFSHSYHDGNRSRHMKRRRDNESPLSSLSRSNSSDGRGEGITNPHYPACQEVTPVTGEEDPFTPRIRNFESSRRTRMPNNVKTYDGMGDPEDHVKIFQTAAQVERWAMPTWCHMFNPTLIGAAIVWFDELPPESIDSYKDLKAAFLAYFMQQKKYVKDPVEIHNIKQKDGETIEDFMERFKVETGRMKRAPESAAASKKKGHASWKAQDQSKRQNSDKRSGFRGHSREGMGSNRFTPLTRTPKEILAAEAGKLSHFIKEIKHGRDQSKTGKKETTTKDKTTAIYMIQSWQRTTRQKVTQSFERVKEITFPPLAASSGTEGPLVIKPEIHDSPHYRADTYGMHLGDYIIAVFKEERTRPDNFKVVLHLDFPDQKVAIGGTLSDKGRTELCSILKKNLDIFSWQPSDMTGVPRSVVEHRLNIWEGYSPVRQKKKGQAPERAKAIQAKVQTLMEAGIMREVYYHDWLSNPFMDWYPIPEIDWKVESLCGYPFKCFLDVYKGYHQTQLAEPDEEKIAFHTGQWVLAEGVFLGYVVIPDGIKPCPDKTAVVLQLPSPRTIKEVQSLNGKLASLNRFLSKSAEKSLPLFKTLKKPRTSVKGQILADFLIEMPGENPQAAPAAETQQEPWTLFTDGSSCADGFGARLILTNPEEIEFAYALRFQFAASNNEAEYEALIAGLRIAARMGVNNVHVSVDSKLVAKQVLETYVAKEDNMVKYLYKVKGLVRGFTNFSISQVPRSKNKKADALSKIALTSFAHLSKQVLVEVLKDKSIKEKEVATVVEEDGLTWMTPIVEYLKEGTLPNDKKEARKLRIKARQYELMEGILYRRSFLTPWLRCVGPL